MTGPLAHIDQLGTGRGYDAKSATWNFPALWKGGTWRYGDIVAYQVSASWALLVEAAKDRRAWLESYVALGDRAMSPSREWSTTPVPTAFVIPKQKQDPQALQRLIWTLQHGQVEVRESTGPIAVGSATYPAGSYVISTTQPYGGYAKALLERQKYPDLREYPGGPPKRPYDVTAHTLPLLFGVAVAAYTGAEPSVTAPVAAVAEPMYSVPELSRKAGIPRIAIYRSFASTMDEGWTRWMFDAYGVAFTSITDKEVRGGNLGARFDVVIIPDQNARQIAGGLGAAFPDSLRGGLGEPGAQAFAAGDTAVGADALYTRFGLLEPRGRALELLPALEQAGALCAAGHFPIQAARVCEALAAFDEVDAARKALDAKLAARDAEVAVVAVSPEAWSTFPTHQDTCGWRTSRVKAERRFPTLRRSSMTSRCVIPTTGQRSMTLAL